MASQQLAMGLIVSLGIAVSPMQAQSIERASDSGGMWFGTSLAYGVVGTGGNSSGSGLGYDLTGGLEFGPWRFGARVQRWVEVLIVGDQPARRSRTTKAIGAYHTESGIAFTGGFGRMRIWDRESPSSARAWVAETGIEFVLPRESDLGLRFYAVRDWAMSESEVTGGLAPGRLYQFHVGFGFLLH